MGYVWHSCAFRMQRCIFWLLDDALHLLTCDDVRSDGTRLLPNAILSGFEFPYQGNSNIIPRILRESKVAEYLSLWDWEENLVAFPLLVVELAIYGIGS